MMRMLGVLTLLAVYGSFAIAQQPGGALTVNQLSGFRHLFLTLGNPNLKQADIDRRLVNFTAQLGLSAAEAQVLSGVVGEFRQTMKGFTRATTRAQGVQLEQARDARITELACNFLAQLPLTKQSRILADYQDPSHGHSLPPTRR